MKNEFSYALRGIIRALGEGVCLNILLPMQARGTIIISIE